MTGQRFERVACGQEFPSFLRCWSTSLCLARFPSATRNFTLLPSVDGASAVYRRRGGLRHGSHHAARLSGDGGRGGGPRAPGAEMADEDDARVLEVHTYAAGQDWAATDDRAAGCWGNHLAALVVNAVPPYRTGAWPNPSRSRRRT